MEIESESGSKKFCINGQRLKYYFGMSEDERVVSEIYLRKL